MTKPNLRPASVWLKFHKIGQAHLAPNMTLEKWQAIIYDYLPAGTRRLDALTPAQTDEIIDRISKIVRGENADQT